MESKQDHTPEEELVKAYGRTQLKKELREIHRRRQRKQRAMQYALVAALVLIVSTFLFRNQYRKSSQADVAIASPPKIYEEYFSAYPVQNLRKADSVSHRFQSVLEVYARADYQAFISQTDSLELINSSTRLYLGVALLATGQLERAVGILGELSQSPIYGTEGKWYLALALIRSAQYRRAREILFDLSETANPYQQPTKEILARLDSLLEEY